MRIELCLSLQSISALAEALGAQIQGEWSEIRGIATDSREVQQGDIFVALQGAHANGAVFVPQAIAKGAAGVLVAEKAYPASCPTLTVTDPMQAILRAARQQRQKSRAFTVAVSGSTGKTTVKEGIASVLSRMGRVERTQGNFNSSLGLPLSVLAFEEADFWVCEVGINHAGEMLPLASALHPDLAVLTNVGHAHIGHFKDWNALLTEKVQIAARLRPGGRLLVPETLSHVCFPCERNAVSFVGGDFALTEIIHTPQGVRGDLITPDRVITNMGWPIPGSIGVSALTAIAAAGWLSGATDEAIRSGVEAAGKGTPRMRRFTVGERLFVEDGYNASPEAVVGALEVLTYLAPQRPLVAVLGDMLELGDDASSLHFAVGQAVAKLGFSVLLVYGEQAEQVARGALESGMCAEGVKAFGVKEKGALIDTACKCLPPDAAVLFKASGKMGVQEICAELGRRI